MLIQTKWDQNTLIRRQFFQISRGFIQGEYSQGNYMISTKFTFLCHQKCLSQYQANVPPRFIAFQYKLIKSLLFYFELKIKLLSHSALPQFSIHSNRTEYVQMVSRMSQAFLCTEAYLRTYSAKESFLKRHPDIGVFLWSS